MNKFIEIKKRYTIPNYYSLFLAAASIIFAFFFIGVIFALRGINPFFAFYKIVKGSFGSFYGITEIITKTIPLILVGIGLSIAFKGKFWNIGAEGQILAGAIGATWMNFLLAPHIPQFLTIPSLFAIGFIFGAFWAVIPAWLKIKFSINEVISTLMLNYIIAEIVQLLVYGPWKGETQFGFPYTDNFSANTVLTQIPGTRIHFITLLMALLLSIVIFVVIRHTKFGFQLRVVGENSNAARYSGMNWKKIIFMTMVISGGIAGLAGVGEVAGIHKHLTYPWTISGGYGFTGILVAWIAKLHPLYCIVAALFISGILVGGDTIQTSLGLPAATIYLFNGIILLSIISSEFFKTHEVKINVKAILREKRI